MDAQAETLKFDVSKVDMSLAPVAYGYDDEDLYCGTELFSLDPLESENAGMPVWLQPGNTLKTPPGEMRDGHVWKRVDDTWQELEDHRGETGFVNVEPFTIKAYGPLPDGWSDTPPPLTTEELFFRIRGQRDARINSVLWMRERHSDELALGKETSLSQEQYTALLTYIQALRDLPAQPGAPWDGGGELTPWPEVPEV